MASISSEQGRFRFGLAGVGGNDRLAWYFLRISGIALVFFALGHMFITHYLNAPSETDFDFVAARWSNTLWLTFDSTLLIAALWHGLVGFRFILADYVPRGGRVLAYGALWLIGLIFTVLGLVNIFTFDVEAARNNAGPLAGEMWIGDVLGYSLYAFAVVTYIAVIALVIWVLRNMQQGVATIYNGDAGQYAWVLHRATGAGILFFLLVHILDIMLVTLGRDVYDHTVEFYAEPFIIPMEILLVGAVVYHTLNGLRVIAVNFSSRGPAREKKYFWAVLALSVLLTIPSVIVIFSAEF
ncbi:MAG TPA: succinate dehydrogenase, cytochrome b556 subunit [Thermomicrobiales bacterium]|nr:succinate dehydrogenase, cytochrome b556 subunit [Thermomicrobiales bacterium]